ncbi:MAG: hypothetical protein J0M16_01785 [Gammaproteobacteria bacterium]|nr:hypothetical protein [Gammaproteobacteria bacterium]
MALTIATKIDLQLLRQEMATKADIAEIRADVAELRQSTALLGKEIELLSTTMTVRLGSMLMLGLGLPFCGAPADLGPTGLVPW